MSHGSSFVGSARVGVLLELVPLRSERGSVHETKGMRDTGEKAIRISLLISLVGGEMSEVE